MEGSIAVAQMQAQRLETQVGRVHQSLVLIRVAAALKRLQKINQHFQTLHYQASICAQKTLILKLMTSLD